MPSADRLRDFPRPFSRGAGRTRLSRASARLWFVLLLAPFSLASLSSAAGAQPLRFLAEAGYAPYSFAYGDQARGIDCELFQELARRLSLDAVVELHPREELLALLERGEADGAVALNYRPELADRLVFARRQAMRVNTYDLFSHAGHRIDYQGPESLAGLRVALPQDANPGDGFQKAADQGLFTLVRAPGESACVRLLLMNQADVMVGQTEASYDLLSKMGMTSTILSAGKNVGRDASYVAVSRGLKSRDAEDLARLMELVLKDMLADGTYRKIRKRYLLQ